MKILYIGMLNSSHTVKWVNAFSNRGHQVMVATLAGQTDLRSEIRPDIRVAELPKSGFKGYYLNGPALRKLYKEFRPDVSNAHYASGYGTLARMAGIPDLILSVWGSDVYEFPYQSRLKETILKKNINYASHICSTSHCMARQVEKIMGRSMDITITPFGVDTERFRPAEGSKEDPEHKVVFSFAKLLIPNYRADLLIEAYRLFVKETEGAAEGSELRIYGDGSDRGKLEKLAADTGLPGISFMGMIPNTEMPEALRGSDVFCCVSENESFGVSAVEAMACGIPVIATDTEGFVEVVSEDTGFIVPRNDVRAIADRMKLLYENEALRKTMGEAGRRRVLENYDWNRNVDTMLELYRKVIGG